LRVFFFFFLLTWKEEEDLLLDRQTQTDIHNMLWQTVLAASLLASGAQAGIGSLVADGMRRGSPELERRLQEIAKLELQTRGMLEARQSSSNATTSVSTGGVGAGVVLNADGTINMTAWETTVNAACTTALDALSGSSNPSGTCVCYNLPVLDNSTGTFEADLRLYQLNSPTGQFAGIAQQNIQVGLSYRGSSVTPVTAQTAASKVTVSKRQSMVVTTGNPNLKLLQTYLFVGQIDKAQMSNDMTA
jgi:hypothetical protein